MLISNKIRGLFRMVSHHFVVSMQNTGSIGDIGELSLRGDSIAHGSNRPFNPD